MLYRGLKIQDVKIILKCNKNNKQAEQLQNKRAFYLMHMNNETIIMFLPIQYTVIADLKKSVNLITQTGLHKS